MAKKRQQKNQSLVKNIALLFLSLSILAGASLLFSTVNGKSDFSFDPFHSEWSNLIDKDRENKTTKITEKTNKTAASAFEYTYWDILLLQDDTAASADNNYSIQIASFKSNDQALIFAKSIKEKTHLQCKVVNTGNWSAVRWGSFPTKDSAQQYCKELSSKLNRECIVIKM
ncbi:MAG: SPOR domain-containing protein [Deltaproteobacteria bacterium]|nr:SPOR domain-containing protein [Deltaproteobacteria bacterium]